MVSDVTKYILYSQVEKEKGQNNTIYFVPYLQTLSEKTTIYSKIRF